MKKSRINIFFIITLISAIYIPRLAVTDNEIQKNITGAWEYFDFYYLFDSNGVMNAIKIEGTPKGYKSFRYSLEWKDSYGLISYGKNLSDSSDIDFIMVDEVTDSTAVFAYGTPFIRADTGTGLIGSWKHVKGFESVIMTIGIHTFDYLVTSINFTTGATITKEERNGTYTLGKGKDSGRFNISFDDGTSTVVFPLIFGEVMYFFDLSKRKSLFIKTEHAPTFREYQKATGK